ncbi:response regulator [uncultured Alsobacter sp.]|uniref:response regulator n=1 Tax=uncultured Alsobacter sp. TaxID=1748258 RepID=UPI0025ED20E4|nr:response regulator [uncultured Alsobacter sp.]
MDRTGSDSRPDDLKDRRVLIVEDEFFIAEDIAQAVQLLGGSVLGPVGDLSDALAMIARTPPDLAVLDINLSGEMVFPAAEELRRRGIPFVFQTGYSGGQLPAGPFATVPCWSKPYDVHELSRMLARMAE